jgi:hypothetical protein
MLSFLNAKRELNWLRYLDLLFIHVYFIKKYLISSLFSNHLQNQLCSRDHIVLYLDSLRVQDART